MDTYAGFAQDPPESGGARWFDPAVITAKNRAEADADLSMLADFLEGRGNVVEGLSYPGETGVERTLVILKPDNWAFRSCRPGAILDIFSRTGLRIVAAKIHRFSLAQALEFYGPVEDAMRGKLSGRFAGRAAELLEREFDLVLGDETVKALRDTFGIRCAEKEFGNLVEFMCGRRPESGADANGPGDAKCMILVYEGANAVAKIRDALGPTNPAEAPDGTVRREFGSSIMVNAAHASDSTESFLREKDVVKIGENAVVDIIRARAAG